VLRAEGDDRLREVVVSVHGRERRMRCDWLGAAFGLVPQTDLARLLGCEIRDDAIAVNAMQQTNLDGVFAVGECTGVKGDGPGVVEGEIAGRAASGDQGGARDARLVRARAMGRRFAASLTHHFAIRPEVRRLATAETLLCRCEDVPLGAVDPAWSARQAKLYTRVGMGSCQGAICGEACKVLFGWEGNRPRPPLGAPMTGAWGDAIGRSAS
jgi:hypothetical protein